MITSERPTAEAELPAVGSDQVLRFDHLERMLTDVGLWQHTAGKRPDQRHGYSIDDEARGLIVGLLYWDKAVQPKLMSRLAETCFRFIQNAAISEGEMAGRYHNFCDKTGCWLDPIGSDDSFGRTFWGLGIAYAVNAPFAARREAEVLLRASLPVIDSLRSEFTRSMAFVMLGLAASQIDDQRLRSLADTLADCYEESAAVDWHWFESHMTYENARLPEAMLAAAAAFPEDTRYRRIGMESLDFLLKVSRSKTGAYAPVGNEPLAAEPWFKRGDDHPPLFDQQPVDAGALVEACALAYQVTGEPRFRAAAYDAFAWYLGKNVHGIPIYDERTGAVADALNADGISLNQGAESVLSVHLARLALQSIE